MCSSPIHVTSSQLIASEIFPVAAVKALIYPGAVTNGLITNMTFPSWDNLLNIYNLTNVKEASAVTDLQRLEVGLELLFVVFIFYLQQLCKEDVPSLVGLLIDYRLKPMVNRFNFIPIASYIHSNPHYFSTRC